MINRYKIGFCLGNTFDAFSTDDAPLVKDENFETCWQAPYTSTEIIQNIKNAGFETLLIPITLHEWIEEDMDSDMFSIDSLFINRLKEVIDEAINFGLKVIVSLHGDGYLWIRDIKNKDYNLWRYKKIWEYLSVIFSDYDDVLGFEAINELIVYPENTPYLEKEDYLNELMSTFVTTVRNVSGNETRPLIIQSSGGLQFLNFDAFSSIDDSNIYLGVHFYEPWFLTIASEEDYKEHFDGDDYFSKNTMLQNLSVLKDIEKNTGLKIIITECGSRTDGRKQIDLFRYFATMIKFCKENDISMFIWNNGQPEESINRISFEENVENLFKLITWYNKEA